MNPGTLTNPSSSAYNNVLAGQLAAAIINVTFGSAFSSFAPASANLKDLVISSGPFFNKNVSQVINFANQIIGGCSSAYSATDLNTALTAINSSYDNGTMAGNYLACPIQVTSTKNNVTCNHGNNGSICITSVSFNTHGFTISNTNKNFLLRIIQEFLSNSLKHSECKNILLDFKYTSDGLQAIIKDDGKGFDLNNSLRKPKEGIGLLNMKKRAELIGASFSLSSIVGDGTTLRIFIPQSKLNV